MDAVARAAERSDGAVALACEPPPGQALDLRDPLVAPALGNRAGRAADGFGYRLHILLRDVGKSRMRLDAIATWVRKAR
jgi:hypothetical protein